MDHGRVMDKGQVLHIHAQIGPVDGQDILGLLRQLQRVKHLLGGVCAGAEHVGVFRLEHLGAGVTLGGGNVGDTVQHLLEQVEKRLHLGPAAGDIFLHGVNKGPDPGGHDHVHGRAVGISGNAAVAVRDLYPLKLDPIGIQNIPHIAGVIGRAVVADLVEGGFYLETASAKAGSCPAGQIVLLDQQGLFPRDLALERRRQSGIAGAYDDYIIFCHRFSPFLTFGLWLYQNCYKYNMLFSIMQEAGDRFNTILR